MKKYLFIAASALALASCSSEDFVGTEGGNVENSANKAINFGGKLGKITRANNHVGADAAALLNNKFIVTGFKGEKQTNGIVTNTVFDHYTVTWEKNTAGTTTDNTSDWKYVGLEPQTGLAKITGKQTIKYWDYSTGQYDYIAFSSGKATIKTGKEDTPSGDDEVKVTAVTPATATKPEGGAYTIQGTAKALHKCYIADLITAYNPEETGKLKYQNEVQLSFRNLTSKVRVAFYETIPGYSVKDVKFYTENTSANSKDITETGATLFTQGDAANNKFYGSGTATVYFPTVGTNNLKNSDYNKAHVALAGENGQATKGFGTLNYTTSADDRLTGNNYLSTTTNQPTYAGGADDHYYQIVLPNEAGTTLTLRVNYTLVANDNSGETITVYGAKAIVPAKFAEWKSNYAYTYVFKISDNTNGKTGITEGPEGLYPITFDAVVADSEIGNQTTITTVATPSITTYQKGHDITKNEYSAATGDIYVMVKKPGKTTTDVPTLATDLDNAKLYTVTDPNKVGISEATVHDALTIGSTTNSNGFTGRNGIILTNANMVANFKTIPGIDGNDITITEKTAAKFTPTAGTYAFVYQLTTGTKETFNTAYKANGTETVAEGGEEYYTDFECTDQVKVGSTLTANKIYYQKITNNNNTYAIKVIKVVK